MPYDPSTLGTKTEGLGLHYQPGKPCLRNEKPQGFRLSCVSLPTGPSLCLSAHSQWDCSEKGFEADNVNSRLWVECKSNRAGIFTPRKKTRRTQRETRLQSTKIFHQAQPCLLLGFHLPDSRTVRKSGSRSAVFCDPGPSTAIHPVTLFLEMDT